MIKKVFCVTTTILLCLVLCSCSLALPAREKSYTDKLCGVWVVVSKVRDDVNPNGFKNKNAIVLSVSRPAADEVYHCDSKGRISNIYNNVKVNDDATENATSYVFGGKVYFNNNKQVFAKAIELYKDANGEIHSDQNNSCWIAQSCQQLVSGSYSETVNGKTEKEEIEFEISFEVVDPLKNVKISFLTDSLKVIGQKEYEEKELSRKSGLAINAPKSCKLVLIEETRVMEDKSIETKYFVYSLKDADDNNIVTHLCAVQMPGLVAGEININIKLQTAK